MPPVSATARHSVATESARPRAGVIRSSTNVFHSWHCGHCQSSSVLRYRQRAADVRIEVEDRVARQVRIAADEGRVEIQRGQHAPDLLVDGQAVRIVGQRVEQQVECGAVLARRRQVARQRQARAPVLRVLRDEPLAQRHEPPRRRPADAYARSRRSNARYARSGAARVSCSQASMAPAAGCPGGSRRRRDSGTRARCGVDRRSRRRTCAAASVTAPACATRARSRCAGSRGSAGSRAVGRVEPRDLLAHVRGLRPLLLVLVQLLQVDERVAVLRIELHDLLERLERAVDEPAVAEVEARGRAARRRARAGSGRAAAAATGARDRAADLSLLAVQVAEDHLDLERVGVGAGGLRSAPRSPGRPGCRPGSSGRACSAASRAAGAGRSSGRRAACSAPTPCRRRGRRAAPASATRKPYWDITADYTWRGFAYRFRARPAPCARGRAGARRPARASRRRRRRST